MRSYQSEFIEFVIKNQILRFGSFTLKSGRVSPYFFNAGLFNTGSKMAFLADSYAQAIAQADLDIDTLFGPAYKGIPLVAATSMALARNHSIDLPWCFNRKEVKDHGEGGNIVGASLSGKTLIIDDVITAGTAIREAADLIKAQGAVLAAIIVAMDRQEVGTGTMSAIQEIASSYQIPIVNIISLQDIIDYLAETEDAAFSENLQAIVDYRDKYGVVA
ncbi:MAG: orotate phosphoribosyltransferase [Pseudohongiella sp.]|nr:MAG: orotate phosphoribosyltransferase [Pseudohongiella sp.]